MARIVPFLLCSLLVMACSSASSNENASSPKNAATCSKVGEECSNDGDCCTRDCSVSEGRCDE